MTLRTYSNRSFAKRRERTTEVCFLSYLRLFRPLFLILILRSSRFAAKEKIRYFV